ncbi:MAG TPA: hypothetical protein VK453_25430 [Micromonosporaceae bacterium]|nr:hypothetical protein [Micromonosporaceae bacterium]
MSTITPPHDENALARRLKAIEDRISTLDRAPRLGNATVSGSITIDGGTLILVHRDTNAVLATFGPTGWVLYNSNGTIALQST